MNKKILEIMGLVKHGPPDETCGIEYQGRKFRQVFVVFIDAEGNERCDDPEYPHGVNDKTDLVFEFESESKKGGEE